MKTARYSTSRQKSCVHCSDAKAKCNRKAESCTRCTHRGLRCIYPQHLPSGSSTNGVSIDGDAGLNSALSTSHNLSTRKGKFPESEREISAQTNLENSVVESTQSIHSSRLLETLDFLDLELFCPINADDISNRWLNSFVPVPGQKIKEYPASITAFIYRILKSFAAVTVRGRGAPPFVHVSQMTATLTRPPLSTCLTLVRMCEKALPGSESVAADILQREMNSLYEQHATYDDMDLLAAFQAYLIYSMVLFFRLGPDSNGILRQAMMNLQSLASSSSRRGLVCVSEQQRIRPRWEAWIVAEAKRRTLFAMYLFDGVLSAQDGLPTHMGTELQGLPAPANQLLWKTQTRHEWETAYNIHLADWAGAGLLIEELWPIPADLDERGLIERRCRVDLWLENIDEFGTMLYAVTSCTHGG